MPRLLNILRNKGIILSICLTINLLSHLPFINLPPRSVHVWRQCNTLAVARNFYREDMDILNPRVDRRLDTEGVTGMQFPSYEYIVAAAYQLFGEHFWVPRLVSLLISSLGIVGMYLLSGFLFRSELAAAFSAWAYAFSPELFYFGFNALPDILALAASVWGLYLFLKWFEKGDKGDYFSSLLLITLAGLTKIQFLAMGFFIAAYILTNRQHSIRKVPQLICYAAFSVGITLWWYIRSLHLIEKSGLTDFGLTFKPVNDFGKGLETIMKNLSSDLPELLLNYAAFVLFIAGIVFFIRNRAWKSKWFLPMLAWTLSLIAYHIIELGQMDVHSYYMMPYLPVLFLIAGYAAGKTEAYPKYMPVLITLLIAQPVLAYTRIVPARWSNTNAGIPAELYEPETRIKLIQATPANELSIVGPDISGCIYFYFLEKKGFGFNSKEDLAELQTNKPVIELYIERGAKSLYTNDSSVWADPVIAGYLSGEFEQVGNFRVYRLKSH